MLVIASDGCAGNYGAGFGVIVYDTESESKSYYSGTLRNEKINSAMISGKDLMFVYSEEHEHEHASNIRAELCGFLFTLMLAKQMGASTIMAVLKHDYCINAFNGNNDPTDNADIVSLIMQCKGGIEVGFMLMESYLTERMIWNLSGIDRVYAELNYEVTGVSESARNNIKSRGNSTIIARG